MQHTTQSTGRSKFLQPVAAGEWLGIGILTVIICLLIGAAFLSRVIDFIPLILAMSPS